MSFNAKKCYILSVNTKPQSSSFYYQLNNTILKNVDNNPYLGLLISKDLKWTTHIDKISNKASSTLGFITRNTRKCPMNCRKTAYIALVRSTLEYGSTVWDPYLQKDIARLETVTKDRKLWGMENRDTQKRGTIKPGKIIHQFLRRLVKQIFRFFIKSVFYRH